MAEVNNNKLLIQRIGLVAITQFLVGFSSLILLPVLTKNMSIQDYGIWAQITVTIGIIPQVVMFGLPFTMVRHLPPIKSKRGIQELFYSFLVIILFATILTVIVLYLFATEIAYILFDNNILVVKILAIVLLFECMNLFFTNYLRASKQIKKHSLNLFIKIVLRIVLVSLFVLSGYGIAGAAIGLLLSSVIVTLVVAYDILSEIGIYRPRFENMKEYLSFGIPTIPGNLSSWVVNSSDRYVIGLFLGTAAVGYYNPGYSLGNIIGVFVAPFSFMLPVVLSEHYDNNNIEEVKKILSYS
ncbi:MAG: oligosaccharide flippase family protein [Methanolobus sp.]